MIARLHANARCQIEGEATALSLEEQSILTKLQQSIREYLERRRLSK